MFRALQLSFPNAFKLLLVAVVLAIISVSVGLTFSPSNTLHAQRAAHSDQISGVSRDGWIGNKLSFKTDKILPSSAYVRIALDEWRPKEAGKAVFTVNEEVKERLATGFDDFTLPLKSNGELSLTIKNTFAATAPDARELGVKLKHLTLAPRYLLLIPSVQFALLPTVVATLCLLCGLMWGYNKEQRTVASSGMFVVFLLVSFVLASGRVETWPYALPLAMLLLAVSVGVYAFRVVGTSCETTTNSTWRFSLAALVIFTVAACIRFSGLTFGLPDLFHPDEPQKAQAALRILETGDFNPHYFRHPSFLIYSTAFLGKLASFFMDTAPTLPDLVFAGRMVSAALGSLSVLLVFALGARMFNPVVGLLAAITLSVTPLHVVCSRYLKEDASLVFFVLLAAYLVVRWVQTKRQGYFFWSAIVVGCGTSTKYSGAVASGLLLVPTALILAARLNWWPLVTSRFLDFRLSRLLALTLGGFALAVVGFLLITPFAVLDPDTFIKDFLYERRHMQVGHTLPITAGSRYWSYHLIESIIPGITPLVGLLAIAALGWLVARHRLWDIALVCLVLAFYLPAEWVKAKPAPQPERYILPCIPFLALAFAVFVQNIYQKLERTPRLKGIWVTVALASLIIPFTYTIKHTSFIKNDTRKLATSWVQENLPEGSLVIVDWKNYGPTLAEPQFRVLELASNKTLFANPALDHLRKTGAQYLILSSLYFDRFLESPASRTPNGRQIRAIIDELTPLQTFSNKHYAYGFHNPTIHIYRLDNVQPKA